MIGEVHVLKLLVTVVSALYVGSLLVGCGGSDPRPIPGPDAGAYSDVTLAPSEDGRVRASIVGATIEDNGLHLDVAFSGAGDVSWLGQRVGYHTSWNFASPDGEGPPEIELQTSDGRPVSLRPGKPVTGFWLAVPQITPPPRALLQDQGGTHRMIQRVMLRIRHVPESETYRVRFSEQMAKNHPAVAPDTGWFEFPRVAASNSPAQR